MREWLGEFKKKNFFFFYDSHNLWLTEILRVPVIMAQDDPCQERDPYPHIGGFSSRGF